VNLKVLLSLFLAIVVVIFTIVAKGGDDPSALIDINAIIIVIGGTIACGAVAFNIDRIFKLLKVFFLRMLRGRKTDYRETIRELMVLASAYRADPASLPKLLEDSKDPFIKESVGMLLEELVSGNDLKDLLKQRVSTMAERYTADAKMLQALGKYPPAMGLMGAVVGMVALLGVLGQPGAEDRIGPAMSVALLATFYGIAFANLFVIPVGEHLVGAADELKIKNSIIVEGVMLISKKTNPTLLAEQLNSFLLPGERLDIKQVMGKS